MHLTVFTMKGEGKCLPLPPHVHLLYVHCNVAEKLGFVLHFLCLGALGAQPPYSCKLIKWEFEGMNTGHKSSYLTYILLQTASSATEGI